MPKTKKLDSNEPRPAHRPSGYDPGFCQQAQKLCALGATDNELADFFGVSSRTIYRWIAEFPDFCQSLKLAKVEADTRVERSLYHRAVGYSYEAVKIMAVAGEVQKVAYIEHVPPDTTAMIFWLKNRQSDKWRDVHKHELGRPGEFDDLTDEQLRERITAVTGSAVVGSAPRKGTRAARNKETLQ